MSSIPYLLLFKMRCGGQLLNCASMKVFDKMNDLARAADARGGAIAWKFLGVRVCCNSWKRLHSLGTLDYFNAMIMVTLNLKTL